MLSYTIHFTRTVNTGELSSTHDISGAGDCIIDGPHATLVIVATLVGMATATVATVVAGIVRAAMASAETSSEIRTYQIAACTAITQVLRRFTHDSIH